jgi:prevent-host-death family protein
MYIKPSTMLRNDYPGVSRIAHETAQPVFITRNGEGDTVLMSIEAYEHREDVLRHRADVLAAELNYYTGASRTYSTDEVRSFLAERRGRGEE